ncbi:hypothetical protein ACFOPQ_02125 [Deinococcus antarcticus]|uniref:Uncharacterized protein n=1 Tax=Deinococcus antarcticus TaxID=1298767 RepID=A0ABV8A563_9DEIO
MFFKKKPQPPKIGGYIGYYNLGDWWRNTLDEAERQEILERFRPLGGDGDDLIDNQILSTDRHRVQFLYELASWFTRSDRVSLGLKILQEAEAGLESAPLIVQHFYYSTYIELRYKQRKEDPSAIDDVKQICYRSMTIAPKVAAEFLKLYPNQDLPRHVCFNQLIVLLKKEGNSEELGRVEQEYGRAWS